MEKSRPMVLLVTVTEFVWSILTPELEFEFIIIPHLKVYHAYILSLIYMHYGCY